MYVLCVSGIQYQINEKTKNCSIQGIPVSALDAVAEAQHIRLRHASELIFINPNVFIYKGTVSNFPYSLRQYCSFAHQYCTFP